VLASCTGAALSDWLYLGFGLLENPATGKCLAVPSATVGTQADVATCTGSNLQTWQLPDGLVSSAAGGGCMDDTGGNSAPGTQVTLATCDATKPEQLWSVNPSTGWLTVPQIYFSTCLSPGGNSSLDGAKAVIEDCDTAPGGDIVWLVGPGGELIDAASGKCLDDPGSGGPGTGLLQEDCYGLPGEIWAIN
jgi:hypothetical protein